MKEIIIYENMKPCIVYAKAIGGGYSDWLVFISKVEKEDYYPYLHIKHLMGYKYISVLNKLVKKT